MKGRITPSIVISGISLFVALGGTGYATVAALAPANTVGSKAVIDGSIQFKDLSVGARKALAGQDGKDGQDGKPGAVGPQGAAGVAGPVGPAGAAGGFDPAKITLVTGPRSSVPPNTSPIVRADCPPGTTVIAGGGFTSAEGLWLSRASGNGWVIGASGYQYTTAEAEAFAVCAAP
jgi:hypothetical protein